jgi:uncharacterized protein involved in exopolysaccharide biosynthesis
MATAAQIDSVDEEYVDLGALWSAAWQRKTLIVVATFIVGIASVVVTLLMPDIYRATALLTPVAEDRPRGLGSLGGGLSALAGLAGLNLGADAVDNTTLAMQTLTSREFLTDFAKRHDLLVPLFAAERWDPATRKWVIDPTLYNAANKTWVRKVEAPAQPQPADWEVFDILSKMVSVEQDPKTGLVRVSVESRSPEAAKQWTEQLVRDVNAHMRQRDLDEADRSIRYLEQRLTDTTVSEIRLATIQLIEEQMKTVMLAEARHEYVFRVLDPPVVPVEKSRPKRALICVIATLIGGFLATVGAVVLHFAIRKKADS